MHAGHRKNWQSLCAFSFVPDLGLFDRQAVDLPVQSTSSSPLANCLAALDSALDVAQALLPEFGENPIEGSLEMAQSCPEEEKSFVVRVEVVNPSSFLQGY